ncbi:DUF1752 domain-containing protein [Favolaschia claudopus]|uniref:DUF1752 domain-containing protein n=1 Tax=Favolaschia claudopus TaxID=2862362 RepID=A0AAV9Z1B8_9AGAR
MAHYLPVLLVSVSANAISDDNAVVNVSRGQVDYLSHEWAEEDVWRSWRNMTRQKNEIANGMRLENASWRTWWKQRNKLKTISPETLNWLKDSDVTWLYGPLHTAPDPTEVGKLSSAEDRLDLAAKHKPILKHRSISENASNEDEGEDPLATALQATTRPPLLQTKSASHVHQLPHAALRKPSPPRVPPPSMASEAPRQSAVPRRHITFNTFVEQCIAVDSPRRTPLSHNSSSSSSSDSDPNGVLGTRVAWNGRTNGLRWAGDDDESEDDDDDDSHVAVWPGESAISSDSDDEDILEVCLPRSRSNSSHGSRSPRGSTGHGRPPFVNANSFSKAKPSASKTIAPIPPHAAENHGCGQWGRRRAAPSRGQLPPADRRNRQPRRTKSEPGSHHPFVCVRYDDSSFDEEVDADMDGDVMFTHRSAYFSTEGVGVYDYLGGPDLGVEFAPRESSREGGRPSVSAGAEIVEIEQLPNEPTSSLSPHGAGSRSRSRSKSRRTPSPAILPAVTSSSSPNSSAAAAAVAGSVSPTATSPRSPSGLLSPPPRGRDSSQSSSSSASQREGRGRSVTRTSSSSSLSDRERSRSSHTSPMGSLSPEYGGVRVSADHGSGSGYVGYGGGVGAGMVRRSGSGSSPDGGGGVSPEKGARAALPVTNRSDSSEEGESTTSSGATATRPRVEVNGVADVEEDRGRGLQVRNPYTPANSPVVRISKEPLFVSSPANSVSRSSSSSTASVIPPEPQPSATSPPPPPVSSVTVNSPTKKPASPTKSIPISLSRSRLVKQANIDIEQSKLPLVAAEDLTPCAAPTPANSPIARMRAPPRIPDAPAGAGSTAKSIPNGKPGAATASTAGKPPPVSPARATFQTSGANAAAPSANSGSGGSANTALQRTLIQPPSPDALHGPNEGPTMVGRAVGVVSSAGAYFGLWSGA